MAQQNRGKAEEKRYGKRGRPKKIEIENRRIEQQLTSDQIESLIRNSGNIGMTRLETAERVRIPYNVFVQSPDYMELYATAFSEHKAAIMQRLFERAVGDGDIKALTYLAEHHLGRGKPEIEDKRVQALQHVLNLTPEERRARIVELTKKLAVNQ